MALSRPVYNANRASVRKKPSIETSTAHLSPMKRSSSHVVTGGASGVNSDTDEPKMASDDEINDDSDDGSDNLPRGYQAGVNPNPRNFALEQRAAARKEETRALTKSRQKEINKYKRYLINDNIQKLLKKYSVY